MKLEHFRVALSRRPTEEGHKQLSVIRRRCALREIPDLVITGEWLIDRPTPPARGLVRVSDILHPLEVLDSPDVWRRCQGLLADEREWFDEVRREREALRQQMPRAVQVKPTENPKWAGVRRHLDRYLDTALVADVCELWRSCVRKGHVDVSDDVSLSTWLLFLDRVGIKASHVVLMMPGGGDELLRRSVNATVAMTLGCQLRIDSADTEHGLPRCYFLVSSAPVTHGAPIPPASLSMAGFHSLFVAACVARSLRKGEK